MGQWIAMAIGGLIGLAIGLVVMMGLNLGIVYAYMWVMNDWLGIPYVPASSTLFAMCTMGAVIMAIIYFFVGMNNRGFGVGLLLALLSLVLGPLGYAAAFRAHAQWTHVDLSAGEGPYLPSVYWAQVERAAAQTAGLISDVLPAANGTLAYIENNTLLTTLLCNLIAALVFAPLSEFMKAQAQKMQAVRG